MWRQPSSGLFGINNTCSTAVTLSDLSIKFWVNDTSGQAVVPHVR
jgi:hypothetical protein